VRRQCVQCSPLQYSRNSAARYNALQCTLEHAPRREKEKQHNHKELSDCERPHTAVSNKTGENEPEQHRSEDCVECKRDTVKERHVCEHWDTREASVSLRRCVEKIGLKVLAPKT
jgi:hypothetical protein